MGRRLVAGLGAFACLAWLAGCGTTVPLSQRTNLSGNSGLGGPASGSSGSLQSSTSVASRLPGASGLNAASAGGSTGTAQAGGGSGAASPTGFGPAISGSPSKRPSSIRLGVIYLTGLQAAYKTVGAKSSATDSEADYKAVIAYINAHGGVGGIPLVGYYYAINSQSTTDPDTQLQAACTYFTEDQKVDMVATYTPGGLTDSLMACLRSKGMPAVDGSTGADVSAAALRSDPAWWEPGEISLNRLEQQLPADLASEGWAGARWGTNARCATVRAPRVGVVTFDGPDWQQAYGQDLVPGFRRAGTPVYDAVFLSVSGTTANQLAQASAGVQNAVLKFSSECIDHVVFVSNVAVDYLFMNVAEQQQYSPRYGLSSLEAPPVIIQNLANPGSQLNGALGYGWSPYSDVDIANFDPTAAKPSAPCLAILRAAGLAPTDNNSALLAMPSCDGPLFAAALFNRWLSSAPGTTLVAAADSLGSGYRSAGAFGSTLDPSQHDGADGYRLFAFQSSCICFRYTSTLRAMPSLAP